ncbi:MAG: energy transducer TonB [Zoogloea sp.]|nr:energy transducer TonB [Zoogloea sp.]
MRAGALGIAGLAHGCALAGLLLLGQVAPAITPPVILQASWLEQAAPHEAPPARVQAQARLHPRSHPPDKPQARPLPRPQATPATPPLLASSAAASLPEAPAPVAPPAPAPAAPPAAAASPSTAALAPTAAGNPVPPRFNADYLANPVPDYPPASRRLGEQGRVLLRVHVGTDGRAEEIHVHQGSGYPRLDQAAAEAVRRWRFLPARLGSEAVAAWVIVPINFTLRTS